MTTALLVAAGYLLGSMPWGYWLPRLVKHDDIRQPRQRQHRRDERLARLRLAARPARRPAGHAEGLRAGARRDAHRVASRRRARGRGGDARALAPAVPALAARRQGGGDLRRRVPRRCPGRRWVGAAVWIVVFLLFRYASLASIARSALAAGHRRAARRALARDRFRRRRRGRGPRAAPREHRPAARRHREPLPVPAATAAEPLA